MSFLDGDILQVKTFTGGASNLAKVTGEIDDQVNNYLHINADQVHSIQPIISMCTVNGLLWFQYTVMVSLRV